MGDKGLDELDELMVPPERARVRRFSPKVQESYKGKGKAPVEEESPKGKGKAPVEEETPKGKGKAPVEEGGPHLLVNPDIIGIAFSRGGSILYGFGESTEPLDTRKYNFQGKRMVLGQLENTLRSYANSDKSIPVCVSLPLEPLENVAEHYRTIRKLDFGFVCAVTEATAAAVGYRVQNLEQFSDSNIQQIGLFVDGQYSFTQATVIVALYLYNEICILSTLWDTDFGSTVYTFDDLMALVLKVVGRSGVGTESFTFLALGGGASLEMKSNLEQFLCKTFVGLRTVSTFDDHTKAIGAATFACCKLKQLEPNSWDERDGILELKKVRLREEFICVICGQARLPFHGHMYKIDGQIDAESVIRSDDGFQKHLPEAQCMVRNEFSGNVDQNDNVDDDVMNDDDQNEDIDYEGVQLLNQRLDEAEASTLKDYLDDFDESIIVTEVRRCWSCECHLCNSCRATHKEKPCPVCKFRNRV